MPLSLFSVKTNRFRYVCVILYDSHSSWLSQWSHQPSAVITHQQYSVWSTISGTLAVLMLCMTQEPWQNPRGDRRFEEEPKSSLSACQSGEMGTQSYKGRIVAYIKKKRKGRAVFFAHQNVWLEECKYAKYWVIVTKQGAFESCLFSPSTIKIHHFYKQKKRAMYYQGM